MKMNVRFSESKQSFNPAFGEVHNISDGGYERGYAAGYENGNADGYDKGHTEGVVEGVASVPDYLAQYFDASLKNYHSENILTIGAGAFRNFSELESISLPNVASVGNLCFAGCPKLKNADFQNAISIGTQAFYNTGLVSVVIPNLETMGESAFRYTSIETIDLHKAVSIPTHCFGSSKLKTLILRSKDMCELLNTNALGSTLVSNGTGYVYVPDELVEQYKAATNWSTYANQIKPLSELEGE